MSNSNDSEDLNDWNDSDDSMGAEFDTVAAWTADVATRLDPAYRIPAGCRGSGSPGAMRWLLDHLRPKPGQVFLDCGGGVGGPAAFAAQEAGIRPLLTDPEAGACRAARAMYALPALRAGTRLPLATGAIGVGWSLGVLCTVDDQPAFLAEVHRVLRPEARFALLVYCATHPGNLRLEPPEGNSFPTLPELDDLLLHASLRTVNSGWAEDFAALPTEWEAALATVHDELHRRHHDDPRWQTAEEQSKRMGSLLNAGEVRGRLLVLEPA